jgi:TolA-binding protein
MSCQKLVLSLLFAGIALSPALAQSTSTVPPVRSKASRTGTSSTAGLPSTTGTAGTGTPSSRLPGRTTTTNPSRQEPCWQVAGVPKSAIQQRQTLQRQARQEIESVCANPSLSVTQKRERIREIHQQEHLRVEALISPQQQEAIRACQQSRGGHLGGGGGHLGGGHSTGPCGTIPGFAERENESVPKD